MSFTKHDAGKLRFDLIDHRFESELAGILTDGAATYGEYNWQLATQDAAYHRYYAACRRHLAAWQDGEQLSDHGHSHLMHAACCIMFMRWFERQENQVGRMLDEDRADWFDNSPSCCPWEGSNKCCKEQPATEDCPGCEMQGSLCGYCEDQSVVDELTSEAEKLGMYESNQ